jgi:hypothetical protein
MEDELKQEISRLVNSINWSTVVSVDASELVTNNLIEVLYWIRNNTAEYSFNVEFYKTLAMSPKTYEVEENNIQIFHEINKLDLRLKVLQTYGKDHLLKLILKGNL